MSHMSVIKSIIKNLKITHLIKACEELGLNVQEVSGKINIRGYRNTTATGNESFIISGFRDGYQVGLIKNVEGEYNFYYDKYGNRVEEVIGENGNKLHQLIDAHKIQEAVNKKGFQLMQQLPDGRIVKKNINDRFQFNSQGNIHLEAVRNVSV